MTARVLSAHRCGRQHRAYPALARCMWPWAGWIAGDGPFAVVSGCGVTSVTLHHDAATAARSLATIDATGCGGRCVRHHELVRLDLDDGTAHEMCEGVG